MQSMLTYATIALKFIIPIFFIKFPFLALWLNYFLDTIDGDLLQALAMSELTYQLIDKSADLFSYVFMLILGIRWKIKRIVIALFVFRLIGQFLFFATGNEIYFFYFQNFLEPLMLVYATLIFWKKSESKAHVLYKRHFYLIWAGIIAYKVWNEWYLHYANIDLSSIFFGFNGGGL